MLNTTHNQPSRKNIHLLGSMMSDSPHPRQNHLLGALPPEVQGRLFPHMELVELPLRGIIYENASPMEHVYFPVDAIISLQYILESGDSTATLVVGSEGLLGITLFMGGESSPSRALVQNAGNAFRLPKPLVRKEFYHGQMLMLMLRYTQALFTQISQTAVCNRHHSIDQQLCRWLLLSLDRQQHDQVNMTQEFIGNMLGVRRESVTSSARKLQQEGVIDYSRGLITVKDRVKLEALCCECYEVVKRETEKVLDYLPQRQVLKDAVTVPGQRVQTSERSSHPA